jgi:hypothetical protein
LGNLVQRQEAFAAADMRGGQGQMAQIRNRLVSVPMVNSQHGSENTFIQGRPSDGNDKILNQMKHQRSQSDRDLIKR